MRKKQYRRKVFPYIRKYVKVNFNPEQREQVVKMRDIQKMSFMAIADFFGVRNYQTIQRIYSIAKDLGVRNESLVGRGTREREPISGGTVEYREEIPIEEVEVEAVVEDTVESDVGKKVVEEWKVPEVLEIKNDKEIQKDEKYVADLKRELECVVVRAVAILKKRLEDESETIKVRELTLIVSTLIEKVEKMLNIDRLRGYVGGTGYERLTTQELRVKVTQNERMAEIIKEREVKVTEEKR
jgi:hypothetical protein